MMSQWKSSGRRGSALLIVLGMFAFMLVSAVSFSIFMRASRAPSSYVRRNVSARHLVKAALARAMDEIDTAIGNDPFPGVGYNHDYAGNGISQGDRRKNDNWHGRVFTPSNEVAHAETVSTLTLEGLGYLPPCLINEARYWSRHTRTAKWHSFNYGLGRYAFTAVNVSDLFELNSFIDFDGVPKQRLNRSSSDHGRISPTYLFRSSDDGRMNTGGALSTAFLNAMADGSGFGVSPSFKEVPFISLMDFNLALGGNALGGISSPFIKRLQGSSGTFYSSVGDDNIVRRQVFMAGGWNGDSNLTYQAYSTLNRVDLRYPECQPFHGLDWFQGEVHTTRTLNNCYNTGTEFWLRMKEHFPVLSVALLCDYLDADSVPVSLCIPSVEANPMICGVNLVDDKVGYKVVYEKGAPISVGTTGMQTRTDICKLEVEIKDLELILTSVCPYQSGSQGRSSSYTAEAFARVFFVEDDPATNDGNLNDVGLRNSFFALGNGFKWTDPKNSPGKAYLEVKGAGAVRVPALQGRNAQAAKAAVDNIPIMLGNLAHTYVLAELTYEVNSSTGAEKLIGVKDAQEFDFYKPDLNTRVDFAAEFQNNGSLKYRPSVAVWAHIKDSDGKTVDMVPAVPAYDSVNGLPGSQSVHGFDRCAGGTAGAPALRFFAQTSDTAAGIELSQKYFSDDANNDVWRRHTVWKQKVYMANDPRYNWAPEQWWAEEKAVNPKDVWIDRIKDFREKNSWCDLDIFMSVSDQGYLQSMYEWLLIPQTRDCRVGSIGKGAEWGYLESDVTVYDGKVRTSADDIAHKDLMWRTYRSRAFNDGNETWEWGLLDDMPFDDTGAGLRVNPYTDITNVMFGAFANMPRDWWAAGTNSQYDAEKNYMKAESPEFKDTNDYLFEWSYEYDDIYAMTVFWMNAFRKDARDLYRANEWADVFDGFTGNTMDILDWSSGDILWEPAGVDVGKVKSILQSEMSVADRKFLYGYLKGCFANNHQLFLVFVRAEAAASGGGAGSGARAVALVWRDPNPPSRDGQFVTATGGTESPDRGKDNASKYLYVNSGMSEEAWRLNERKYPPHKMRVLFYHQLD